MRRSSARNRVIAILVMALSWLPCAGSPANAQTRTVAIAELAPTLIVPHSGVVSLDGVEAISLSEVRVGVLIHGPIATTTIEVEVQNETDAARTAEVLLPLPDGAVVHGFDFQGSGAEPAAYLMQKDLARETFDGIVYKARDPALLELIGFQLARSSVFPVEARKSQKIRVTYEQVLPRIGNRIDYELPRSEARAASGRFFFTAKIKADAPIATVFSPSHEFRQARASDREISVQLQEQSASDPGPLQLCVVYRGEDSGATVFVHPSPTRGTSTFLALLSVPVRVEQKPTPREITLVIDRSGSMKGGALTQVAQAALDVVAGLRPDETFNLIAYNGSVREFANAPRLRTDDEVRKAKGFLESLTPRGGTNIHDALAMALSQPAPGDRLPLVLFLTDGVPTVGVTAEAGLRALATQANPERRRVFTFGVGLDINTPLLDGLAADSGGFATWILPGEDPGRRIERAFARLENPVLTDPRLEIVDARGNDARFRVQDLCPSPAPDLYRDETLLLVGTLEGSEPVSLRIHGDHQGEPRTFTIEIDPATASIHNTFVPRLHAARRVAFLAESIRGLGPEVGDRDPRLRELVEEVVRLSTEHGVMTEYTAFLALEGTDLTDRDEILAEAERSFQRRAVAVRSGRGAVRQEMQLGQLRTRTVARRRAAIIGEDLQSTDVPTVRQVHDLTFYRRRGLWIDARLVGSEVLAHPRSIAFGTGEYRAIVRRLADEGQAGCLALGGDVIVSVDAHAVRLVEPARIPGRAGGVGPSRPAPRGASPRTEKDKESS